MQKKAYIMRAMRTELWINLSAVFGFSGHYFRDHKINIMRKVIHILKVVIATNNLFYITVNFKFFHLLGFSV